MSRAQHPAIAGRTCSLYPGPRSRYFLNRPGQCLHNQGAARGFFQAHHALVPLETPSHQIAIVLSARADGLDPSEASRVFCFRHATITTWLSRAGEHAPCTRSSSAISTSRTSSWTNDAPDCTTPNKSCGSGWSLIPARAVLPVLHLGSRMQNAAHSVIHPLRPILIPGYLPLFTGDGLNLSFSALTAHFGQWLGGSSRPQRASMAGGGRPDRRPGEAMLPAAQAGARHVPDAAGHRGG